MTTQIKLEDVVATIKAHAFATTDLPLILSIENHCNIEQQDNMAYLFEDNFKSQLLTVPIDECETELPSPWKLRNKIIVKNRKLKPIAVEVDANCIDANSNNVEYTDHDYDEKPPVQGIVNLVGDEGKTFPKYVTLFENGEIQFSEIKKNDCDDENESRFGIH